MTSEQARTIVDQATSHAVRDVRARHTTWVAFAVLLASIVLAAFWFGPRLAEVDDRSQAQDTRIGQLVAQADKNAADGQALRDQVVRLGGTPVVEPAQPGTAGATGATGPVGQSGRDGRDGVTPPCMAEPDRCRGPVGAAGAAGADGKDGANGADGQSGQSPPCLAEPGQCRGTDGRNGADGANGEDGQPPAGWTTSYPDGTSETCARADPFDPGSPRYECTRSAPPSTDPPLPIPGGS